MTAAAKKISPLRLLGRSKESESERLLAALGLLSANVMIADADYTIRYINGALMNFLKEAERDIQRDLPNFNTTSLIGQNIDIFHKNPAHQRGMLANLPEGYKTSIKVGGRMFGLAASPIRNAKQQRIGTVVEWSSAEALDNAAQVAAINKAQAVIHFNMDGTIISANENFLSVMGYGLHEVKGNHHSMFADPQFAASKDYKDFWAALEPRRISGRAISALRQGRQGSVD